LTFRDLLTAFAAAVEANDGEGLASLFTEDGTYEDGFFGAHAVPERLDEEELADWRAGPNAVWRANLRGLGRRSRSRLL
jgi:hypothetical protein